MKGEVGDVGLAVSGLDLGVVWIAFGGEFDVVLVTGVEIEG